MMRITLVTLAVLANMVQVSEANASCATAAFDSMECKWNIDAVAPCNSNSDLAVLELLCDNIYAAKFGDVAPPTPVTTTTSNGDDSEDEDSDDSDDSGDSDDRRALRGSVNKEDVDNSAGDERELLYINLCPKSCVTDPSRFECLAIGSCRRRELSVFTEGDPFAPPLDGFVTIFHGGTTYMVKSHGLTSDVVTGLMMAMNAHPMGLSDKCMDKVAATIADGDSPVRVEDVWACGDVA